MFTKVLFLGPSCSSSTLLHSVHSSKHPPLTIIYTLHADTRLFMSFSPSSISDSIDHYIHNFVVTQISSSMTSHLQCLNPLKTEFIPIGHREQLECKKYP